MSDYRVLPIADLLLRQIDKRKRLWVLESEMTLEKYMKLKK